MKHIGIFTSGGDAPGMNACLRAATRKALAMSMQVTGIRYGYAGMLSESMTPLTSLSVSGIIQEGGTILKSSRCLEFKTVEGRKKAVENLARHGIEGLIAIGGNGTAQGALALHVEHSFPIVQCASTIDNDLYGTDFTIGFDTAVNTALQAIDKIRDTASSHERVFFVEVMGRDAGHIALHSALAGGAEAAFLPETKTDLDCLAKKIAAWQSLGKQSLIFIVAEGEEEGGAFVLAKKIKERTGMEYRVCILGHIQRGGMPTARDRVLATRLGAAAVEALVRGARGVLVGDVTGNITLTPLAEAFSRKKALDSSLAAAIEEMAG
ncbi:MAG: 6-phosphofructokinase [Planctomycetota bacterium]|nr:6-phosphofructokinase [Planctomycetota bacterium]